MPKIDSRIEALEAKLKQLKVQQQRSEQRSRTIAARRSRHEELRKKILVGAVVLAKVDAKEFDEKTLRAWMDRELTRADDRALFGLDSK
jgi:predicted RNase H-like nuclease (RuvC/YqgF family)